MTEQNREIGLVAISLIVGIIAGWLMFLII